MTSLVRPLAAVICIVLVQGLLYMIFFTQPYSVQKFRSEAESEKDSVGSMSTDFSQNKVWYNKTWSESQARDDGLKSSRFEEEINRDLTDMKVKMKMFEAWMRNTSAFLEIVKLRIDSESKSNLEKRVNNDDSKGETPQLNGRNEPNVKPLVETFLSRRNKGVDDQRGLIAKRSIPEKLPVNQWRVVKVADRPLNALEEYYLTVRNKRREIRNGPIVNPIDFRYVINPGYKTCSAATGSKVFLIAFVPTSVDHYDFRRVIRTTWAVSSDYRLPVRCVFIVGRPSGGNGDRIQQLIEEESTNFGDIVQAEFLDTYNNLTYKSLVGLRWVATYCPDAKYVLKIDDDTFVNMFALLDRLQLDLNRSSSPSDLKIFCRAVYLDKVHRTGKWAVPEMDFRPVYYPPYCSGPAYVLTMTVASQIVMDSLHVPFFHFEDVFVTGFVTMLSGHNVRFVQWDTSFAFAKTFPRVFLSRDRNKYLYAIEIRDGYMYRNAWSQMRQLYMNSANQTRNKGNIIPKRNESNRKIERIRN